MKLCYVVFLVCTLFTCLLSLSATGQTSFGIKGGMNIADFNGYRKVMEPRIGLHAGIFAERDLHHRLSLRAEVLYSQKGMRGDLFIPDDGTTMRPVRLTINFTYLDVPLLLKYRPFNHFSLYAGPQLSLLAGKKALVEGNAGDKASISGQGYVKLGLAAGISYVFTPRIGTDLRYNRELVGGVYNSQVLQIGISYKIFGARGKGK